MKVLVIGSTGLVGVSILNALMGDSEVNQILTISRKNGIQNPKIQEHIIPQFENLLDLEKSLKDQWSATDMAICCLGTTIKVAGSQENFRKVDFEYVLQFAKLCKALGIEKFGVVSAAGSSPQSKIFYSRIKGEMEEALIQLNFKHLIFARPGVLIGQRNELRVSERFFILISPFVNLFMLGTLAKYRSVQASSVAGSLISHLKKASLKVQYLEGFELIKY